jgi:hypothetical protein
MTYKDQVRFWLWAMITCYTLGVIGIILWVIHGTLQATVAGVMVGPFGISGGTVLTYEYIKVKNMEPEQIITYVTRGELRRRTVGVCALLFLYSIIFLAVFVHLVFNVG